MTPDSFAVVDTVPTQRGARILALDPRPRPAIVPGSFVILVVGR